MKSKEYRVIYEDVKTRMAKAKKIADAYEKMNDPRDLFDVAELIVDNKILIGKRDAIIGKKDHDTSSAEDEEEERLSQSMIDELYDKYRDKKREDSEWKRKAYNLQTRVVTQFSKAKVVYMTKGSVVEKRK